jgi:ureidoglycolate hydrolase
MIPIRTLSAASFSKYGQVIEQRDKSKVFTVVLSEAEKTGWRIGYLIMGPNPVDSLEAHPASMETFEPVSGTAVILVAEKDSPSKIEAFLLDAPVCVAKNIWHGVKVLSETAEIKIMENYDVESVHYKLEKPIDAGFTPVSGKGK